MAGSRNPIPSRLVAGEREGQPGRWRPVLREGKGARGEASKGGAAEAGSHGMNGGGRRPWGSGGAGGQGTVSRWTEEVLGSGCWRGARERMGDVRETGWGLGGGLRDFQESLRDGLSQAGL